MTAGTNGSQVGDEPDPDPEPTQPQQKHHLELFHRAWIEQNATAWEAIYHQYQPLVSKWVRNYSRFSQTGEEAVFFVNEAFIRMIQRSARLGRSNTFVYLGQYLQYLKLCVESAIEDYLRRRRRDALTTAVILNPDDDLWPVVDGQTERILILAELRQLLAQIIQDERERLVAEESWVYGLAPRHIQSKYPEIFTTVTEASQVKRNLVRRLKQRLQ